MSDLPFVKLFLLDQVCMEPMPDQIAANFNQEKYICLVVDQKLANNTSKVAGYIQK
jgi:hypothetical protein